jgi:two-component system, NtrC family, sensor kinase
VTQRSVQPALIRAQSEREPLSEGEPPSRELLEAEIQALRAALDVSLAENAALAEAARAAQAEAAAVRSRLVHAAKLASLGELVARVAHEINNPLSFALSHLGMLRRGNGKPPAGVAAAESCDDSSRVEERLASIGTGLERIRVVVSKLQTYSRMEDGKSQAVDVAEALGVVTAILEHRTPGGIVLSTDVGRPARIECDPSLFYQSVMNLLVNAIDAIDGQGEIRVSAGAVGGDYVVRVVDSGRGIPDEIRQRVFEPFFTTKPVGKGTGLGLAIAAAVVESHGGTLALRAGPVCGTEAEIRLPLTRVAPRFVP